MLKRNHQPEADKRKKISLPAALFNRSPLKNSENSSFVSNHNSISREPHCQNHPAKKGKYTAVSEEEEDEQMYYCEKCAILLASRGFEVQKIEASSGRCTPKVKKVSRDDELNSFLETVEEKIQALQNKGAEVSGMMESLDQVMEERAMEGEELFETILEIVEKQKKRFMESLYLKRKHAEEELESEAEYVRNKIELLETMKEDITMSHQSIVEDTPEEDYQLVMAHYRENVAEINSETPAMLKEKEVELPSIEAVQQAFSELMGGQSSSLFSFESQQ